MKINVVNLGMMPYGQALDLQVRLVEKRQNQEIGNTLLLLEHPPVLTLGTRGQTDHIYLSDEALKSQGIDVFRVNRGGDVTYHGPGQIVGYPIFDYRDFCKHIRDFVELLEQAIIDLLQEEYGISAHKETDHFTGVWVGDVKICALGIAVKRWITMHGFAFNVNTNLDHFKWINPCGLSRGVTSVAQLTGREADLPLVYAQVAHYLAKTFACETVEVSLSALLDELDVVATQKDQQVVSTQKAGEKNGFG